MKTSVTPTQIKYYQENGFVHHPGLLSPDEVAELKADVLDAAANMTRKRRIAMTCGYMPDGCTFNGQRNILPKEYFESLKKGDTLCNNDWNPLVHPTK